VNPTVFKIIDGRLYLNWSTASSHEFEADVVENIKKADANWDRLQRE
jgi:hypothetical protein